MSTTVSEPVAATAAPTQATVRLASGLDANLLHKGSGPPLLFLHGSYGRTWPAFLDALARRHTVYAPLCPGADEPAELESFDGFSDLALFHDDLLRALAIDRAIVVGHAFGGMVAAEFAAHFPERVARLVLIDAWGLWTDTAPVADIHSTHPKDLAALQFAEPQGEAARSVLQPAAPDQAGAFMLARMLAQGAATHFYWPIPDRDLRRRLYRISADTLLVWGEHDRVVKPLYAQRFADGIAGKSRIVSIAGAGHWPHIEQPEATARAVLAFTTA